MSGDDRRGQLEEFVDALQVFVLELEGRQRTSDMRHAEARESDRRVP